MARESDMDSLFEGMDFVMPLEDESPFPAGAGHKSLKTGALASKALSEEGSKPSAPLANNHSVTLPSLDPPLPSSGPDLRNLSFRSSTDALSSDNVLESLSPAPASPSSHGGPLLRGLSEPLDESLFSGLTMSSLDNDVTTTAESNLEEASEGQTDGKKGIQASVGSIQHERSPSFENSSGGEKIGNGDKYWGSTESIRAVYDDASPNVLSIKRTSSGTPPISKAGSGSALGSSPAVKPSMRRKKRSMKIGYGREEEENEELASRKTGIREAIGAALLGKDALNSSSHSTPRRGLSRESSQIALNVDESTLASSLSRENALLNGVKLVKETSANRLAGSQYSTLEVFGIERVASREVVWDVAPQLESFKPDVLPMQVIVAVSDKQDSASNDQSHRSAVEEAGSDIEVATSLPSPVLEATASIAEAVSAEHEEDEGGGEAEALQDKKIDELDIESLAQRREGSIEERLGLVKEAVALKLKVLHEKISAVSAVRKASVQKRRQAAQKVTAASAKYKELEAELDAACEKEDFDKAEILSGSIAEAEANVTQAGDAFSVAEGESDSAASEVQEVLDLQVEIEEKGARLLELLKQEAEDAAEKVLKEAQEKASLEMERLVAEEKTTELKRNKLELDLKDIEEAKAKLNKSVEDLTQSETKEKLELTERRNELGVELQELMALVKTKEAEIADYDERIAAVDDKVNSVAATFGDQKIGLDAQFETYTTSALQLEKDSKLVSEQKQGIEGLLAEAEQERLRLETVARLAFDAGKAMQAAVEIKKAVAVAIMQSREKRTELVEKEKQAQAEAQLLRQNAASMRVSLQELTSMKGKLSQELAAVKERIIFVEKRGPELDTEKKQAAAARNFKVAGRIAAEAKVLAAEKEAASADITRLMKELEKVEGEAEVKLTAMADLDNLVIAKEREGAMALCERLRLVAAAARDERDIAIELDDSEEAKSLDSEAKAADEEAEALQRLYQLEGREYQNYSPSKVGEDAELQDKEAAMANCERLRLVAAAARDERDAAVDLDQFEEAETLHCKAEAADAQADKIQRLYQLEGKQFESQTSESQTSSTVSEDVGVSEDTGLTKVAAMADCERLRLVAAAARDERDTAIELDVFDEAEIFDSNSEAADGEADKLQRLFQLEGRQYQRQINSKTSKDAD